MSTTTKSKNQSRSSRRESSSRKAKPETKVDEIVNRPVWEMVAEVGAQISDDDWTNVPEDSSIHFKRYARGSSAGSK